MLTSSPVFFSCILFVLARILLVCVPFLISYFLKCLLHASLLLLKTDLLDEMCYTRQVGAQAGNRLYNTPQACFVVPVRVVYAVGFGAHKMVCISAENKKLVACTKSSQMCKNEVRITERGFIFIGACNASYNRIGEHNFKTSPLFCFLFSIYLLVQLHILSFFSSF